MATATRHPYLVCNDILLHGAHIINGTRPPIRAIADLWKFGVAPKEITVRLPHVTLAQAYDALSGYQEHWNAIDADIQRNRVSENQIHPSSLFLCLYLDQAVSALVADMIQAHDFMSIIVGSVPTA
jgi:uncharacterized protein (DUF433 family)